MVWGLGFRLVWFDISRGLRFFWLSLNSTFIRRPNPNTFYSTLIDVYWGKIVREISTLELAHGKTLDDRGYWRYADYYFMKSGPNITLSFYFWDLSHEFYIINEFGHVGLYDEVVMDVEFSRCLDVNTFSAPLREDVNTDTLHDVLRRGFNIGSEFKWRLHEPHERICHRPRGNYIRVSLEYLRVGWRPQMHQFLKNLYKYRFGLSMFQFSPNSIWWMNWFLGVCHKQNLIPTYKLFDTIFQVQRSTMHPLFWVTLCWG